MTIPRWTFSDLDAWNRSSRSHATPALAMYRGDWGALTTDPRAMTVPVDDHLVHRGDGVFETLLAEGGAIYNVEAHLRRLRASASAIQIRLPWEDSALRDILRATFRAADRDRALARVLVGRGPGGFSVSPAESSGTSLYVVVYAAPLPFTQAHPGGARAVTSAIPPKAGGLATIKTCNYIPNALMKREALDRGVDFALGVDAEGYLTESATENVAAVPGPGTLLLPPSPHHLAGTTLARLAELMAGAGWRIDRSPIRAGDLFRMGEVLIVGTTAYVTPLVELDGKPLPTGGEAARWRAALEADIRENPGMRTGWQET